MKAEKTVFRWGDGVIYLVLVLLCAALFLLPALQRNRPVTAQISVGGVRAEQGGRLFVRGKRFV